MAHLKGRKRGGNFGQNQKGPLRKIKYVLDFGDGGLFSRTKYHLECGHDVWASNNATHRARCWICKREAVEPATPIPSGSLSADAPETKST